MQSLPWKTVWIRGELSRSGYIWQDWFDQIIEYAKTLPDHITHFGAQSDSFKSGKYLSYSRGEKRLLQALNKQENFKSLSFISAPPEFTTMIQDQTFEFSLSAKEHAEIQGSFHSNHFNEIHLRTFENLARQFFLSGRLEIFSVGANDLPMNYPMNFKERSTYSPRGFQSIKVEAI